MKILLIAMCLFLTGCAGASYVMDTYNGVPTKKLVMPDDTYRIFDRPDLGKLMITPSIGKAAVRGAGQGFTFQAANFNAPLPVYKAAARKWLDATGRNKCKITDGYIVLDPQYEFTYDCGKR